ncbi:hypothetical protein AX14_012159 [Amanita brunnescens Koide BX004]|nr:hypothetical protein AX14_012159 [Amanita brunnescens Koide BX004]
MIGNGRIEADGETIVSDKSTIINSGTDMIVGPEDDVVKIYEKIRGAHTTTPGGFYIFPCDEKIPEITFSWGEKGKKWTMDRESFILSRDKTSHKTKPVCRGAIQSFRLALSESEKFRQSLTIEESDSKTWVFGTSFMRMLYPIFNMKEMQIGFARRKQGGKRPHPESPSEGSHLAHEQKKLKPRND